MSSHYRFAGGMGKKNQCLITASTDLLYFDYFYFSVADYSAEEIQKPSSRVSLSPSNASCVPAGVNSRAFNPLRKRSKSDPVLLHGQLPQGDSLFSVSDCVMVL